jgi:hypothetical protein
MFAPSPAIVPAAAVMESFITESASHQAAMDVSKVGNDYSFTQGDVRVNIFPVLGTRGLANGTVLLRDRGVLNKIENMGEPVLMQLYTSGLRSSLAQVRCAPQTWTSHTWDGF